VAIIPPVGSARRERGIRIGNFELRNCLFKKIEVDQNNLKGKPFF